MKVILLGYRGSGKTSIGKRLAERLDVDFIDTDDLICDRFGGMPIAAIWEQHGEPAFRQVECRIVAESMIRTDGVISLGGGTLEQPAARQAVQQARNALRVYLQATPEILTVRIAGDARSAGTRPALTAHGGGLAEVQAVLAKREPTYLAVADQTVDVGRLNPAQATEQILQAVHSR